MNTFENKDSLSWIDYRRRRTAYWLVFLFYFPYMMILWLIATLIQKNTSHAVQYKIIITGFFAFGAVWYWAGLRWVLWPCPRCGKAYSFKFPWGNVLRRKCAHCGLKKWADPASESQANV